MIKIAKLKNLMFGLCVMAVFGGWVFSRNLTADVEMAQTPSPQTPPSTVPGKAKRSPSNAELERKFLSSQRAEYISAQREQQVEIKELKAAQSAAYKEWTKKENEERHKFFAENKKGQERRAYIHDFQERRKIFFKVQKDDLAQKRKDHQIRLDSYRQDHEAKLKEFRDYLKKGESPPEFLWPKVAQ